MTVPALQLVRDIVLRDYQSRAIESLRQKISNGSKRVVLILPTGGGKTVVAASIVQSAANRGNRVLFVCHRRELIDQTVDKLRPFGIQPGVIMANDSRTDSWLPVQVASVQTLIRRMDRLPEANVLIFDEVHHAASSSWRKILDAYPSAVCIGLTATPFRTDKLGLRDIFDDYALAATPSELMDNGALVRYEAFAYDAPDLHEVGMVAGEYNQGELELACNTQVLVGSAVKEYVTHASGRSAIIFPVSIAHSQRLVEEFKAAGVTAEHIDFKTAQPVRADALDRFKTRKLTVISSVGILCEGFDAPIAEVAILCRPTKSLALHLQMCGRILRPAPGKSRAMYHDHAGNLLRHGLPDDPREWNIQNTPQSVIARKTCPACFQFVTACVDGKCPHCGQLIAMPDNLCGKCGQPRELCACPETKARRELEQVGGRRIDLEEIRARRAELGIDREISDVSLRKVALATREEKIAEYKRLQGVAAEKGLKPGFVSWQYRSVFSKWPRFSDEELKSSPAAMRPFIPLPGRRE